MMDKRKRQEKGRQQEDECAAGKWMLEERKID